MEKEQFGISSDIQELQTKSKATSTIRRLIRIKAAFAKLRSKENNEEMNFDKYATMGEIIAHLVAADGFAFR